MIRGQTTKLKDKFRCLSPDCSGPLCVSVSFVVPSTWALHHEWDGFGSFDHSIYGYRIAKVWIQYTGALLNEDSCGHRHGVCGFLVAQIVFARDSTKGRIHHGLNFG